jgi:tRNA pseudouridine55 synthase
MFSAVKVDGKRLYELARQGKEVAREARPVTIHRLELGEVRLPEFTLQVECSKGTYIRTLAADLGAALGCGAHLAALRRTRSGPFQIADAVPLAQLLELGRQGGAAVAPLLVPLARAFEGLPGLKVDQATLAKKVGNGVPLAVPADLQDLAEGARVMVLDPQGELAALAERKGAQLKYLRVLPGRAS